MTVGTACVTTTKISNRKTRNVVLLNRCRPATTIFVYHDSEFVMVNTSLVASVFAIWAIALIIFLC